LNEWVGRVAGFAYVAIMLVQVMDVLLRYCFNSPTIWAWDVNAQLFLGTSILGGGYVLLRDGHVRVDVLYSRVGPIKKAIFDLVTLTLTTLALALLSWQLSLMVGESWRIHERSWTLFAPPLYPIKTVFFIGVILLLLQAIAHAYRRLRFLSMQLGAGRGAEKGAA
jgi:TRAP-type mannitol/chloroaromatic compound transport system permease small subunit